MYATLSAAALVAAYNTIATSVDAKTVTRFSDRTVGSKRLTDLIAKLTEAGKFVTVAEDGAVSISEPETTTLVETTSEGAGDNAPVADEPKVDPVQTTPVAETTPVASAKPVKAKGGAKSPSVADADVIYVKVEGNPKKAAAAERYAFYRNGLTVAEYIKAVGDRRQGLRDLAWDVRQGWVEVVGPAVARKREAAKAKAAEAAAATATESVEEVAKAA